VHNPQDKTTETAEKPKRNFPIVPTTKILAIGQFATPPTPEQIKEIFPKEVPATLKLYLDGETGFAPSAMKIGNSMTMVL